MTGYFTFYNTQNSYQVSAQRASARAASLWCFAQRWQRRRAPFILWVLLCADDSDCEQTAHITQKRWTFFINPFLSIPFSTNLGNFQRLSGMCVFVLLQVMLKLPPCIRSLDTHLCPARGTRGKEFTRRRWNLENDRIVPVNSKTIKTHPAILVCRNVGHSHGPITEAACYQQISVTVFTVLWYSKIWSHS